MGSSVRKSNVSSSNPLKISRQKCTSHWMQSAFFPLRRRKIWPRIHKQDGCLQGDQPTTRFEIYLMDQCFHR
jgi:hypothetical protein